MTWQGRWKSIAPENELAFVDDLADGVVEAGFFKPHGAVAQPVVLGHGLDERFFGRCLRLVLLLELSPKFIDWVCDSEGSTQNPLKGVSP